MIATRTTKALLIKYPATFRDRVRVVGSGCWKWTGSKTPKGYGLYSHGLPKTVGAHRWSYEHAVGPIPSGLVIDHLCRVKNCVNPAHLEAVTQRENCLRGQRWPR